MKTKFNNRLSENGNENIQLPPVPISDYSSHFPALRQFRKYSNEFLNIGAGARGLAMGSAQVASVADGTAGYWNPAGLVGVKDHPQFEFNALRIFCRYWKI